MKRTGYCGSYREENVGEAVTVMGWVQTKRDMGGVIFIDLRDREGTLQVVFDLANLSREDFALAEGLRNESVVAVSGVLRHRSEETYNPRIATGAIELKAQRLSLLSQAQPLPFAIDDGAPVREELRLKYRYLDIRRPQMLANLRFRHRVQKAVQDYLDADGFIEVETPMLCKSTPEGARDYLVPSRVHPGSFYALPQSPQIFKQLLMVGGVDKYYQVARCFRDEDLRADRQPEFTQVDMELSFVEQEDILQHLERLFRHLFQTVLGITFDQPFPRLSWHEAMDTYGSDKPDLRFGLPIVDITKIAARCGFSVFRGVADKGGVVRAINVKGCADFTRTAIEELTAKAVGYGAKGMAWIAYKPDGEIYSILTKYLSQRELEEIFAAVDAKPGDFILFCADQLATVRRTLGGLRLDLGDLLGLRRRDDFRFLFVTDFPQFEYSEEEKRWVSTHHPFTMPYPEDLQYLFSDPGRVRAQAYDVVLNGIELGSGSMRIYQQEVQQQMFEALGFSEEQIEERFGFLVNAFRYGTPPHGGFAFGLDRLVMQMLGADSLREVIAFPKMKDASCPMTSAPDVVDDAQLEILGIVTGEGGKRGQEQRRAAKRGRTAEIDVDNVANLSRLTLTLEEKEKMREEMAAIIGFANQLSEIDAGDVPVTAHVLPMKNVWRDDRPVPSFGRDELLANTPSVEDGYIYVPRVVE
ncbi:aspartate--tRNA ligase [Clostridiaceae bacterium NSJ-31]|uniref:Multifunctional fusion protein n=1 Tax=Ligaoa zhengdingensis TaxID=2763658 RepID=A0A926I3L7_9FIRM|nr:aspartate--tRNA ligase [Ligaoa zhengdingensis]MBC8545643.1 aspartate--tRNA ligase [Ligaoa zhengdingensis]